MATGVALKSLATGTEWDLSGNALSGRQVFVYTRGTTTQVQVYSDSGLTTPLTQPLVTGTDGVAGAVPGYVAGGQDIDFVDALTNARSQANPLDAASVVSVSSPAAAKATGVPWVFNVRDYGAKGDGVTDDTTAIQSALTATPNGGTLYFPNGQYLVTSTITINQAIYVQGQGVGSALLLNVGGTNNGLVIASTGGGQVLRGVHVNGLAIVGAANCCSYALVVRDCLSSVIDRVYVKAGAANYGVSIEGCEISYFRVFTGSNLALPYTGTAPTNGIRVVGSVSYPPNANWIDSSVDGCGGNGLVIDGTVGLAGSFNNWISGTYEGVVGKGVWLKSCTEFHLYDAHIEGSAANQNELRIENCQRGQIGPGVLAGASASPHNTNIVGCTNVRLDGVTCDALTIDAGSTNTSLGRVNAAPTGLTDNSTSTKLVTQSAIDYNPPAGGRIVLGFNQANPIIQFGTALDCNLQRGAINYLGVGAADFGVLNAGRGLRVAEGSNAKQGISAAMVAGTVTVANTSVTANSRIQLTRQAGGTNPGAVYESARTAGTSFTITSTNAADTGTVAYEIFEPA